LPKSGDRPYQDVTQSQVMPVVRQQGWGSGAGHRGIEVVVVVAMAMAKGQPACVRGEVSCTIKDEGGKKGK